MKIKRPKCPTAGSYDPTYMPMCATEKYSTCESCTRKWQEAQAERVKRANERK